MISGELLVDGPEENRVKAKFEETENSEQTTTTNFKRVKNEFEQTRRTTNFEQIKKLFFEQKKVLV